MEEQRAWIDDNGKVCAVVNGVSFKEGEIPKIEDFQWDFLITAQTLCKMMGKDYSETNIIFDVMGYGRTYHLMGDNEKAKLLKKYETSNKMLNNILYNIKSYIRTNRKINKEELENILNNK